MHQLYSKTTILLTTFKTLDDTNLADLEFNISSNIDLRLEAEVF